MKLITWNVNGLRACMNKGFKDFFTNMNADIFAIQETKMQEEQKEFAFPGYYEYWNSAEKKGYSGTLVYTKRKPLAVFYGFNGKYNDEGRAITLEYETFYFVTIYSPNAQPELARLAYRMQFEDDLREYLHSLNKMKPVILCGDLNVAHQPIDLKNPKANEGNPGYSIEERTKFSTLLSEGYIDTFRYLYPEKIQYTWWSYRFFAREKGIGWRIDYFIASEILKNSLKDIFIHDQILGSDHCPVEMTIAL
ncbi:MAG: exodeoxyribonuclease III [Bacilli bacterium]|nr:exodeoxyribonuclease III [Bacilli bacterium]